MKTDEARAERKEHLERLQAMGEDDGETWDLSENDKAAIRAGAHALRLLLHPPSAGERTCGTCASFDGYRCLRDVCDPEGGLQTFRDGNGQEYAVYMNRPEFGCLAHSPKEPQR